MVCNLLLFYGLGNLGMDLIWVNSVMIYRDIYSLAKPRLIIFCKKGKNINDAVNEPVSIMFLKSPEHTS
jgi:hypothetical protein